MIRTETESPPLQTLLNTQPKGVKRLYTWLDTLESEGDGGSGDNAGGKDPDCKITYIM